MPTVKSLYFFYAIKQQHPCLLDASLRDGRRVDRRVHLLPLVWTPPLSRPIGFSDGVAAPDRVATPPGANGCGLEQVAISYHGCKTQNIAMNNSYHGCKTQNIAMNNYLWYLQLIF
tara:strand:- start:2425 stop:2772 length:348 start_codon:yes stop_codon:yes gene_type:complete